MRDVKSLAAEIEAVCDMQEHIRNLECVGRRHDANGICRKAIDAGIAALKAQAEQVAWLSAAGTAPDDAGAVAWYQSVKASCDQTLRQQKLKIRDLEVEIAVLQSRAFEDGARWMRERAYSAVIDVRHAAACNFSPEFSGAQGEARTNSLATAAKAVLALPLQPEGERSDA